MALPFLPGNSFNNAVSVCIGAVNLLKKFDIKFVCSSFQHSTGHTKNILTTLLTYEKSVHK